LTVTRTAAIYIGHKIKFLQHQKYPQV